MGGLISSLFGGVFSSPKKTSILMVGLDGAGKTTVLYKLKLDQVVQTTPTIGFNVETIEYKNLKLCIKDVGGQDKLRALWRRYYTGTDAVIFVVDSNDTDRVPLAKEEIHKLMGEDELQHASILVLANKQDLPNALSASALTEQLDLHGIQAKGFNVFVQPSTATTGEGIFEGLDWLANALSRR
eukprot:Sspe_Gene.74429::Locus_46152_Transcript_1_1_Confidence_1.000_Length_604::g.74429::m.74429/K07937/ARF1; ADP-ribosylation factor 1